MLNSGNKARVKQFEDFEATVLLCRKCERAVPVQKKLLLFLPNGLEYIYLCTQCGETLGTKIEKGGEHG